MVNFYLPLLFNSRRNFILRISNTIHPNRFQSKTMNITSKLRWTFLLSVCVNEWMSLMFVDFYSTFNFSSVNNFGREHCCKHRKWTITMENIFYQIKLKRFSFQFIGKELFESFYSIQTNIWTELILQNISIQFRLHSRWRHKQISCKMASTPINNKLILIYQFCLLLLAVYYRHIVFFCRIANKIFVFEHQNNNTSICRCFFAYYK